MKSTIIQHLSSKDDILKNIINSIPYPEIYSTQNVFHDLMSCVIEQQIHYRSTKKIFQKMLDKTGIEVLTLENFSAFEIGFKDVKISTRKYETIERVVDFFSENELKWSDMTNDEVRKTFKQIKGIGPWTVDMILLFTLKREDIFSPDDYHIKNLMFKLYDIDTTSKVKSQLKSQLKAVAEHWSPYRSIATRYLLDWKAFSKK